VKNRLGGHVRLIISGAAPLSPTVQEFIRVCFGCPVVQGYGLTETSAGATMTDQDDVDFGIVGPPVACNHIKLVDVTEMNYTTDQNPPSGEIWIRGPNISKGYFKDEKKTKEDFDAEGWFHTGDIGRWNPNGSLSIIDRKKNIFKLSHGEYIAAEKLELIYSRSRFIAQMMIYGDSFTPFIIAIVRPEEEFVQKWAVEQKIESANWSELSKNEKVRTAIMKDFELIHKDNKLNALEAVKGIITASIEWNADNNLMTPTMKVKRPQMKEHYEDEIVEMYSSLGEKIPHSKGDKKPEKKEEKKVDGKEGKEEVKDGTPKKEVLCDMVSN